MNILNRKHCICFYYSFDRNSNVILDDCLEPFLGNGSTVFFAGGLYMFLRTPLCIYLNVVTPAKELYCSYSEGFIDKLSTSVVENSIKLQQKKNNVQGIKNRRCAYLKKIYTNKLNNHYMCLQDILFFYHDSENLDILIRSTKRKNQCYHRHFRVRF